jgi:prevent-host-death family protein
MGSRQAVQTDNRLPELGTSPPAARSTATGSGEAGPVPATPLPTKCRPTHRRPPHRHSPRCTSARSSSSSTGPTPSMSRAARRRTWSTSTAAPPPTAPRRVRWFRVARFRWHDPSKPGRERTELPATLTYMTTVGVAELRQNLSKYLRLVGKGERLVVTDRNRPVAELGPPPSGGEALDRLIAEGKGPGLPASQVRSQRSAPQAASGVRRASDLLEVFRARLGVSCGWSR